MLAAGSLRRELKPAAETAANCLRLSKTTQTRRNLREIAKKTGKPALHAGKPPRNAGKPATHAGKPPGNPGKPATHAGKPRETLITRCDSPFGELQRV